MNYKYLSAIVKDAIFGACDGTAWKDEFDEWVRLPEMFGKEIEKFAERIATEIHPKLADDDLQKRFDVLFDLYVKHIHEHRLGVGDKCDDCVRLANSQIDDLISDHSQEA